MRYLNNDQYAAIFRKLLVEKPVVETAIKPGMKILYARAAPIGLITLDVAEVAGTIRRVLPNNTLAFSGVLPTGAHGVHRFLVTHHLRVQDAPEADTLLNHIYDKDKANPSDDSFQARYENKTFTFEFRNRYLADADIAHAPRFLNSDGIALISPNDPRRMRLVAPGARIRADQDTIEYRTNGMSYWRIVQQIPDGPTGSFDTLGYRMIPADIYRQLFDSENIVAFEQARTLRRKK